MRYKSFLDTFFDEIRKADLDISGLPLDHIAYQTSTKEDYEQQLPEFSKLGELVSEEIIGGRRVAVVKLDEPLSYKSYSISTLELIEPKEGQQCESAFQHAEFVVNQPFEDYIEQYPDIEWDTSSMHRDEFSHLKLNFNNGLTLKFLQRPILELFEEKKNISEEGAKRTDRQLWYVTHSPNFDYIRDLYNPLKESTLWSKYKIILPYDTRIEPKDSNDWIDQADVILAEVSYPSTGQGIELGWANRSNKKIIAFYKQDSKPSRSIKFVSDKIIEYRNTKDLIKKLEEL